MGGRWDPWILIFTTQNFRIIRDKPGTIKRGWTIEHNGENEYSGDNQSGWGQTNNVWTMLGGGKGAKLPPGVERSETAGERSEAVLCRS